MGPAGLAWPAGAAGVAGAVSALRGPFRGQAAGSGPGGLSGEAAFARELEQAMAAGALGELQPGSGPRGGGGLPWMAQQLEAELWALTLAEVLGPAAGSGLFGGGFAASVYGNWWVRYLAQVVAASQPGGLLARGLVEQLSERSGRRQGEITRAS